MAAMTLVLSPVSGWLVARHGTRPSLVAGAVALIVSAIMLTGLTTTTSLGYLLIAYSVFGIGFGLINPPITNTAVSGMPPSQAGVAAAVASTSRQVGATLGVAVLGSLAGSAVASSLGPKFASATHVSWWLIVGLGVIVLVLSLVSTTGWAQETARTTAERFREPRAPGPAPSAEHESAT